jgi:hypothetical protein
MMDFLIPLPWRIAAAALVVAVITAVFAWLWAERAGLKADNAQLTANAATLTVAGIAKDKALADLQTSHAADLAAIASRQTKEATVRASTSRIIKEEIAHALPEDDQPVRGALGFAVNRLRNPAAGDGAGAHGNPPQASGGPDRPR